MKTRRIVILLLALGLIVALEGVLVGRLDRRDTAQAPQPPAVTAPPAAGADGLTATQPPVASPIATIPQFTPLPEDLLATPTPTAPPPVITPTPVPPTKAPTPTPVPPTKAPTPTPVPTPSPTPTPLPPTDTVTAADSFGSDTGTPLNMGVSWRAVDHGDGTTTISISGTVTSYTLQLGVTAINVSFEGYSASATGSSVNVNSSSLVTNSLFSTSMTVPSGTAGNMTVSWGYNGRYGEVSLGTITATGFVYTN